MRFGSPFGAGYGNPALHFEYVKFIEGSNHSKLVAFKLRSGYGNAYVGIAINGKSYKVMFAPEGVEIQVLIPLKPFAGTQSVFCYRLGHYGSPTYNFERVAQVDESRDCKRVRINWEWPVRTLPDGNLATGVSFRSTTRVDRFPSRGTSGTGLFAWPSYAQVIRGTTNPPSTVHAKVSFDGNDLAEWIEPNTVSSGNWFYAVRFVSDTGDIGETSPANSIAMGGAPNPPTNLSYLSGNRTGMVLSFTPSNATSYNLYYKRVSDETFDVLTPVGSVSGTNAFLPPIDDNTGVIRCLLRGAVNNIEELNNDILEIEIVSGVRVLPRPNIPSVYKLYVTSGTKINCRATLNTVEQKIATTAIRMYVRTDNGSYANEQDQKTATELRPEIKASDLEYVTSGTYGTYYCKVAALGSNGQLSNFSEEKAVFIDNRDLPAPVISINFAR